MELERQKILIDIDDTFLKSSEEIIRQLNRKNGTSKTINDLTDYAYRSIDENLTQEELKEMYASDDFFRNVNFNDGAIDFIKKYSQIFDIISVSYGTIENINKKAGVLTAIANTYLIDNIYFAGFETGKANKREILLDNVYLAIDNHAGHLEELNAPKKILLKNYIDGDWNQPQINDEITYVVNSFKEIDEMIQFDLQLKNMGVWLDA